MIRRGLIAAALCVFALFCGPLLMAQVNPGTTPLTGQKGGTGNAFMQFAGPSSPGVKTFTLPNTSSTIAVLGQAQTWTGAQSFTDGTLNLLGSSSGTATLHAPATSGGAVTFFTGSDTVAGLAATQTLTNKTIASSTDVIGGVTMTLGSDATGDVYYRNSSGVLTRLPVGSNGQVLELVTGLPAWTGLSTTIAAGAGIAVTGTCTITTTGTCTVAQSLTNATLQAAPGNPSSTTSTTGVMMGLGTTCKLTPVYSGRVKVEFIGDIVNTGAATTMTNSVRFGTGTAPINGAAATGTVVGAALQASETGVASNFVPFMNGGIITGLSVGTAVWFDLDIFGAANTTSVQNLSCNAMEF